MKIFLIENALYSEKLKQLQMLMYIINNLLLEESYLT